MAVRDILVYLDGPEALDTLLPAAVQLARDLGADALTAAALGAVPVPITGAGLSLALLDARERELVDVVQRMRGPAERRAAGLRFDWRGAVSPIAQNLLSRWVVRSDLVVVSAPRPRKTDLAPVDIGQLILAAGRPVLVAPRLSPKLALDRVLIGFKSTREGRMALAAAAPLLKNAHRVLLVAIGQARDSPDLEDAAAFLALHGVQADIRCLDDDDDRDAGRILLDLAEADGTDLLVTGAYGRSRARELVFGGVTRTLLSEARLPCLMVH